MRIAEPVRQCRVACQPREQPVAGGEGVGLVESDPALQFFYESRVADLRAVPLRDVIKYAFDFGPLRKQQQMHGTAISGTRQFLEHVVWHWLAVVLRAGTLPLEDRVDQR